MSEPENLIEYLAKEARCSYLSDLHYPPYRQMVYGILERVPAERFPRHDWLDALQYLTADGRQKNSGLSSEEARTALLEQLEK